MVAAIENGYPQREIARAAYEFQKAIEEKRYQFIGVNAYVEDEQEKIPILKIDPRVEQAQIDELREFKAGRDPEEVRRRLDLLGAAARNGSNLMPRILDAVRSKVTLGEIVEELKKAFGTWQEPPIYW